MATNSYVSCPARRGKAVCQIDYNSDDWLHCIHCGQITIGKVNGLSVTLTTDIFQDTSPKSIIVQQVNCKGKMGSGVAKAIRDRYPQVYDHYRAEYELGLLKLGYTSYIEVEPDIYIANICGQDGYGYDGKQYTEYNSLKKGLENVKMLSENLEINVVMPYMIGCGLGGGDWSVVSLMIDEVFKETHLIKTIFDEEM